MLIGVDGRDINVIGKLTTAAQWYERTLFATGGKLALHKCTWVLVNWAWKDGVGSLEDNSNDEGEAAQTLTLTQSEDGTQQTITRLLPSQAY